MNANLGFLLRSHNEIYSKYSTFTEKQISNQLSYWKTTPTAWRSCIDKFLLKTNDTSAAFGSPSIERFGNREVITPVLQSSSYSLSTSPQLQTEFQSPTSLFEAKLIGRRIILLKFPGVEKAFRNDYETMKVSFDYPRNVVNAVALGHQRFLTHLAENLNNWIRIVALIFPEQYQLGNEIFSRDATGKHVLRTAELGFNILNFNIIVNGGGNCRQNPNQRIRAHWIFHKYAKSPPSVAFVEESSRHKIEALRHKFAGM